MQPTKLLNDDPEVLTNYMRCVYLGDVSPLLKGQNWGEKGSQVHFQALIMIFVLADRLCDLLTANIVTAEIIDFSGRMGMLPDSTATNLVYASTASTNPLRALMRDYCVYEAGNVQFAGEMSSKYHTEFFPDVVVEHVKINDDRFAARAFGIAQNTGSTLGIAPFGITDAGVDGVTEAEHSLHRQQAEAGTGTRDEDIVSHE